MRSVLLFSLTVALFSPPLGEEPTHYLSDRNCRKEVLISVVEDAQVFASCASEGPVRIMKISVSNLAASGVGPLRDFSIGFCGRSVIGTSAPTGWVAKVEGDERQDVTWSLPDDLVGKLGIPSGRKATGFVVRLKPGWKRSRSDAAWWGQSHLVVLGTTHDC